MNGQFFWTTADIEKHTFSGELSPAPFVRHQELSLHGQYRVVCGELFRIVDGLPPAVPTQGEG